MSYLKTYGCVGSLNESELIKFLKTSIPKNAYTLKPRSKIPTKRRDNAMTQEQAVKVLLKLTAKLVLGHFITLFTDKTLAKFTVDTIRENKKNKRLFENINSQIDAIYKRHPHYHPCSAKQFMDTSIYNYCLAEFRDKDARQLAKILGAKSLDSLITIITSDLIPLPGSAVFAVPLKATISYLGVHGLGISSLYNMAVEIDGNTLSIGVDFRPGGFRLTNIMLYSFDQNHKLIATYLKDPPESLYRITQADIREIMHRYGEGHNLDLLKKDIESRK